MIPLDGYEASAARVHDAHVAHHSTLPFLDAIEGALRAAGWVPPHDSLVCGGRATRLHFGRTVVVDVSTEASLPGVASALEATGLFAIITQHRADYEPPQVRATLRGAT